MGRRSEFMIQVEFMNKVRLKAKTDPRLSVAHHVPNGGKRSRREALKFQLMGVVPGIPDVFFPIANEEYIGLYIEFKNDRGRVSEVQRRAHAQLKKNGYNVKICRGSREAMEILDKYMETSRASEEEKTEE